ncbi:MAG: hypothetical protein ACR2RE_05820 [Geminicoccaceae bacterium]
MPAPSFWGLANSTAKMNAGITPSSVEEVDDWIQGIDLIIPTGLNFHKRSYRTLRSIYLNQTPPLPCHRAEAIDSHADAQHSKESHSEVYGAREDVDCEQELR